jgi:Arc/MetJ-type ribon-helix-helix transcriptional regulator
MENASLTISLPRAMKKSIEARLREGHFSTPSEYVRSLIRVDLERSSRGEIEALIRGGLSGKASSETQNVIGQRAGKKPTNGRKR